MPLISNSLKGLDQTSVANQGSAASKIVSTTVAPKTQVVSLPKTQASGGLLVYTVPDKDSYEIWIKYGVLYANSYWIEIGSSDTEGGAPSPTDSFVSSESNVFVYLELENIFNRTEAPSFQVYSDKTHPRDMVQPFKPFTSIICLGYVNADGSVVDMRPNWIMDVFAFLA